MLSFAQLIEAKDLLDNWKEAIEQDSCDAEHEVAVELAEFIWRLIADDTRDTSPHRGG